MLEVIKPGLETSIQDYPGRIGYWNQGFPPSGPMDSWSFRLANILVGNDLGAPGLEAQYMGPTIRFTTGNFCPIYQLQGVKIAKAQISQKTPAHQRQGPPAQPHHPLADAHRHQTRPGGPRQSHGRNCAASSHFGRRSDRAQGHYSQKRRRALQVAIEPFRAKHSVARPAFKR